MHKKAEAICVQLRIVQINENFEALSQIKALYISAFPENERRPLMPLIKDKTGHGEVLAFYDDAIFCGFVCLLTNKDICHIIYLAVKDSLRGKGYGSAILTAITELKPNKKIIVDIEVENKHMANNEQRCKRKYFYLHNGFQETEVNYQWRQESYEILSIGGKIAPKDFRAFWEDIYSSSDALTIY